MQFSSSWRKKSEVFPMNVACPSRVYDPECLVLIQIPLVDSKSTRNHIIIHIGLLVAKIKFSIPSALWEGGL